MHGGRTVFHTETTIGRNLGTKSTLMQHTDEMNGKVKFVHCSVGDWYTLPSSSCNKMYSWRTSIWNIQGMLEVFSSNALYYKQKGIWSMRDS